MRPLLRERNGAGAVLVIAEGGDSFRFGETVEADLSRRIGPRRLLLALAQARLERPGRELSIPELVHAAWPGERIDPAAARNRVHVALATLRKLGLEDVLLRQGDGLLIDPQIEVRVVG